MHFLFTQFEFTHALGPPAGRYVVEDGVAKSQPSLEPAEAGDRRGRILTGETREAAVADVLVVTVVNAPAARPRLLNRARPSAAAGESPVPLCLVTFVKATEPFADARAASEHLARVRSSSQEQQDRVHEALAVVNRATRAYRSGAADPYVIEATRLDPRTIRIGYGSTAQVGRSQWEDAIDLPAPVVRRTPRTERLRPAEMVSAVLTGRDHVLESEDLLLRALLDLDQGRTRAAAHQVRSALSLLRDELEEDEIPEELADAVASLADHLVKAEQLVAMASEGPLDPAGCDALEGLVTRAERILRRWHLRDER